MCDIEENEKGDKFFFKNGSYIQRGHSSETRTFFYLVGRCHNVVSLSNWPGSPDNPVFLWITSEYVTIISQTDGKVFRLWEMRMSLVNVMFQLLFSREGFATLGASPQVYPVIELCQLNPVRRKWVVDINQWGYRIDDNWPITIADQEIVTFFFLPAMDITNWMERTLVGQFNFRWETCYNRHQCLNIEI